ncbi:hypothetical protein NQ318_008240 [Aromia moschata]|uniref:Mos1 transposase HTH domain-containing protein n=1 Tax=Aromia moschata TaxID=1265417 RepID=A0AAV8Y8Z9_9CUCU|nr:hypothetical protein NQ318_008240 [Aromia moschata]
MDCAHTMGQAKRHRLLEADRFDPRYRTSSVSLVLDFLVQMEQRVNFKFLVQMRKTFIEAYAMLKEVYGNECLSRTQVFEWFKEGRETTEDDPCPGRPSTSITDENIENSGKIIREDRRLSIRELVEITGIDKECVRQILHESLELTF